MLCIGKVSWNPIALKFLDGRESMDSWGLYLAEKCIGLHVRSVSDAVFVYVELGGWSQIITTSWMTVLDLLEYEVRYYKLMAMLLY